MKEDQGVEVENEVFTHTYGLTGKTQVHVWLLLKNRKSGYCAENVAQLLCIDKTVANKVLAELLNRPCGVKVVVKTADYGKKYYGYDHDLWRKQQETRVVGMSEDEMRKYLGQMVVHSNKTLPLWLKPPSEKEVVESFKASQKKAK